MGFTPMDGASGIYAKKYPLHHDYTIRIDFNRKRIQYADLRFRNDLRIALGDTTTSNFTHVENLVVLECVNRLLEKRYQPGNIKLEHSVPLGRREKGRIDIVVKELDGTPYLLIECKTWGKEYEKEMSFMRRTGGQLFSYYANVRAAQKLCLYTSTVKDENILYKNVIIDVIPDWATLSGTKEIVAAWNGIFRSKGIFEMGIKPYDRDQTILTYKDLQTITEENSKGMFHALMEILRHNAVSDKSNAFSKLLNLFVCKLIDEDRRPDDEVAFQLLDTDEKYDLQIRLNDLYQKGMQRFFDIYVADYSNQEIEELITDADPNKHKKLKEAFTRLRLQRNPDFAFIEVCDDRTFAANDRILREIVGFLQGFKFRYAQKHQFLGDFFELLLNTAIKQESGQFFTPPPIARFILAALPLRSRVDTAVAAGDTDFIPTMIDYACGSGHFITECLECMQRIIDTYDFSNAIPSIIRAACQYQDAGRFSWAGKYVYGIELDYRLFKTAKISAFFNGNGGVTIVWANGLDNFANAPDYLDKLCNVSKTDERDNASFDVLVSNPPYSVEAFRSTMSCGTETFELFEEVTDKSKEIECLFVERMKHLLKSGGWAGVIFTASLLTNGGAHAKARAILLRYFRFKAIAEMGPGTFMKTGTNTVILFLERRENEEWRQAEGFIDNFFTDYRDVTVLGVEKAFSQYALHVRDEGLADYVAFICAADQKTIAVEKDKLLYFVLSHSQTIVLIKSGQKWTEKEFLGYEFSGRRGHEGLHPLPGGGKLCDIDDQTNPSKISSYIYHAFLNGPELPVHEDVAEHVSYERLSSLIHFRAGSWNKQIFLVRQSRDTGSGVFPQVRLGEVACIIRGVTYQKKDQVSGATDNIILTADNITRDGQFQVVKKIFLSDHIEIDESKRLAAHDIFICISSGSRENVGKVAFIKEDTAFYAGGFMGIIRARQDKIMSRYLYEVLRAGFVRETVRELSTGANINNLSNELGGLAIPCPALHIQHQIVKECETIEKETDCVRVRIRELQQGVIDRFIELFGDPVRNPMNWEMKNLGDCGSFKNGMNYRSHENGFMIKSLGVGDFGSRYKIDDMGSLPVINLASEPPADYLLKNGDIVFVRSNGNAEMVGRSVEVYPHGEKVTFSGFCIRYRLETSDLMPVYLNHAFHMPELRRVLLNHGSGANIKNLNQRILSSVKIHIPPLNLQVSYDKFIRRTERLVNEARQLLDGLCDKRKSVMEEHFKMG